jgi:hypothetical protein
LNSIFSRNSSVGTTNGYYIISVAVISKAIYSYFTAYSIKFILIKTNAKRPKILIIDVNIELK